MWLDKDSSLKKGKVKCDKVNRVFDEVFKVKLGFICR